MATAVEVSELRGLIAEPDESNGWTDEKLSSLIDAGDTLNTVAASIWTTKAATFATLVNVSESGSSRNLSDLHKQALSMSQHFGSLDGGTSDVDSTTIVRLRRGFS